MNTEIKLSKIDQKIIEYIAKKRYKSNRSSHVEDRKIGKQSNAETDIDGFGAEYAFCKMMNLMPDFSIQPRSGGVDSTLSSGLRVDVKQTKYSNGKLLCRIKEKENDVDIFVLMVGTMPNYRFAGWIEKENLVNDNSIMDLGYGPTYGKVQEDLNCTMPS